VTPVTFPQNRIPVWRFLVSQVPPPGGRVTRDTAMLKQQCTTQPDHRHM